MSRAISSVDLKAPGKRASGPDLLDLLSGGEPPAFANDQNHRIIFWNKGAERVMDRTAAQALGRLCHEIFCGRDPFGNRFCTETCAVSSSILRNESLNRFEVTTGDPAHEKTLGFTIVEIPGPRPGLFTAVHILDQIDEKSRLARELLRIRDAYERSPHPSAVAEGGIPITLRAGHRTTPAPPTPDTVATESLSDREMDVLRAIAAGLSNKDIAKSLHISVATTRNHVQHILKKLDVHSKLEAVALAFRNGWT